MSYDVWQRRVIFIAVSAAAVSVGALVMGRFLAFQRNSVTILPPSSNWDSGN